MPVLSWRIFDWAERRLPWQPRLQIALRTDVNAICKEAAMASRRLRLSRKMRPRKNRNRKESASRGWTADGSALTIPARKKFGTVMPPPEAQAGSTAQTRAAGSQENVCTRSGFRRKTPLEKSSASLIRCSIGIQESSSRGGFPCEYGVVHSVLVGGGEASCGHPSD